MKRNARWALLSIGIAGVVMVATGTPSLATPPSGLTNVPLALGTNTSHGTFRLQSGTDFAMAQITVNPGGSSGWHSHPGGAIIIVKEGALTVHSAAGHRCRTTNYTAGQAFLERPGEVDDVLNSTPAPTHTFSWSLSRMSLTVAPRERMSLTQARAPVSDDADSRPRPRPISVISCSKHIR